MTDTIRNQEALRHYLALWHTPSVGGKTFTAICERFPDLTDFFAKPLKYAEQFQLRSAAKHYLSQPSWQDVDQALAWQEQTDQHIITLFDPRYPQALKNTSSPPAILFVKGNVNCLNDPQLAIVGTRHPTPYGRENAIQFAKTMAEDGIIVTSGLAMGVDTAAHQGALFAGQTIAVLGNGLNHIYPAQNYQLAQRIAENGAVISEFPLDMRVDRRTFPQRNRIISGMSLGTLVVEAAPRSGSLITAKQAMDQGREVFTIPGSIHSPQSKGCHELLRQGAKLVESAYDILIEIKPALQSALNHTDITKSHKNTAATTSVQAEPLDQDYQNLLLQIDFKPTPVDLIIAKSQLTASEVSSMLLVLELQNYIAAVPGGYARVK